MRVRQRSSWCGLRMSCARQDLARLEKFASVVLWPPAHSRLRMTHHMDRMDLPTECQAFIRPAAGSAESLCFYGCLHFSTQGTWHALAAAAKEDAEAQRRDRGRTTARNPRRLLNARAADRHCAWASQERRHILGRRIFARWPAQAPGPFTHCPTPRCCAQHFGRAGQTRKLPCNPIGNAIVSLSFNCKSIGTQ
jgi:hypothetical protein